MTEKIANVWALICKVAQIKNERIWTGLFALPDRNATPIQTSNFCRVKSMKWAIWWVNLVSSKKKNKPLAILAANATGKYCNTFCCIVSLFPLVPMADSVSQSWSHSSLSIFVRHFDYLTFTVFIPSQVRHKWDSHFSRPNWIEFDKAEMRLIIWLTPWMGKMK